MRSRAAHVNMVQAGARLSGQVGGLVDASLTGALAALDTEVPVGSRHVLGILVGTPALELDGRVVRVTASSRQHAPRWHMGLIDVDVTPGVRRAIPAMVAKQPRRSAPAPARRAALRHRGHT